MLQLTERPRRNRLSPAVRALVQETVVRVEDLVFPLFVKDIGAGTEAIPSMPGILRYGPEALLKQVEECVNLGIHSFVLFPALHEELKDSTASQATHSEGLYLLTIKKIKGAFPQILLISDLALDPYSSDGHDGLVRHGEILNDETVEVLCQMAIAQAKAGVDVVGPSDMMDGRVGAVRKALDVAGFEKVGILSYTAKYASAFYGPFRDALQSAPKFGDKKTYQMNPANRTEALRELRLDLAEGADMVMVKPAMPYLDIISDLAESSDVPVAAYQVSGEYAMIKAAAQNGWLDGESAMLESLTAIKRAGAKIILTYFAKEFAQLPQRTS